MKPKVLIIGAGPVGLTLALTFGKFGVDCVVIERNDKTTQHPKMDITNGRSMEVFRMLGVAEEIYGASVPNDISLDVSWIHTLSSQEIYRFHYPSPNKARKVYKNKNDGTQPMDPAVRISQIVVEPLLRDRALRSPHIEILYGWQFAHFEQNDARGITIIQNSG